jgi:hypothetical protein
MKEPKRVQKALNTLEKMITYLHYYMGDCPEFKQIVRVELLNIETLVKELAVDQKVQNMKLAIKLKEKWGLTDGNK